LGGGAGAALGGLQLSGAALEVLLHDLELPGVEVGTGARRGGCGVAGEVAEERSGGDCRQQQEGAFARLGLGD